jgi:HK97 family phage prohead protease
MSFSAFQKRMAADAGRIHWQPEHYQVLAKHYGIKEEDVAKAVTPAQAVSSFPETVTKAAADVQRSFRWTMNDGEIDRAGDIVVASGVDTSHFRSNPIALLQHDASKPIGTWSGVHAEGGRLKGTLNLAPTRLGEYVRENIAAGVLKAASVGFVPLEFTPIKGGGFRFDKIELMETSIVSIPASRGSLRERSFDTNEERQAWLAEVKAEGRRLDAKFGADDRRKQERQAYAERLRAEAKANQEWEQHLRNTTREQRAKERRDSLRRILGQDQAAIIEQRQRDRAGGRP